MTNSLMTNAPMTNLPMTTTQEKYGIEATKAGIDALNNIRIALSDNLTPIDFLFDLPAIMEEIGNVAPKFETIGLEAGDYSNEELAELGRYALEKIPGIFIQRNAQGK